MSAYVVEGIFRADRDWQDWWVAEGGGGSQSVGGGGCSGGACDVSAVPLLRPRSGAFKVGTQNDVVYTSVSSPSHTRRT